MSESESMESIESLKKAIKGYIRPGYMSGTTSSLVRDVLTVLREIPEFGAVKDLLNAGVVRLVGC